MNNDQNTNLTTQMQKLLDDIKESNKKFDKESGVIIKKLDADLKSLEKESKQLDKEFGRAEKEASAKADRAILDFVSDIGKKIEVEN